MKLTITLAMALLAAGPAIAQTHYPLELENCGRGLRIDAAPERVVTIGQSATEILYALGLADRVKGTSVWFNKVLPQYAQVNDAIPRLADNDPSFETVVAQRPDLVAVQYEWHVGPNGAVASREQFADLGINTYILPADCDTKDNSTGGDGTRVGAFEPAQVYKGIRQLAAIFDVAAQGEVLIGDLEATKARAVARAAGRDLPEGLSAAFWFSSADIALDPYMAGQLGAPGYMMRQLGLRNVVQSDEEWPTIGWESIAKADPDVLVIAKMDRRRFAADDVEKKLEFLRSDPVTSHMKAVREGHIVVMDAHAMSATMRTIYGLDALSKALSQMTFE